MAFKIYAYNVQYTLVRELRCDHNGNNYQNSFLNIFLPATPPSKTHTHWTDLDATLAKLAEELLDICLSVTNMKTN